MLYAFGAAIFAAAALLFLVQPMMGKILLPQLGGSPAVWNTCMVFFQAVLLLGYLYAHVLTRRLSTKWQVLVHTIVLAVAAATLPAPVLTGSPEGQNPVLWVVMTLALSIGLPFFAVSTTGPLLQKWFSRTDHAQARDPYFLYAASNAGSLIGLFAYPLVLEPSLTRAGQTWTWALGFWALVPAVLACARLASRREAPTSMTAAGMAPVAPVTWARRGWWVLLAAVPSSLMLGVTQHVTTDIAAIPLLWIIPLSLYLLSFVLAFSGRAGGSSRFWGRVLPILVIAVLLTTLARARHPVMVIGAIHVATFFVVAMLCHRRLAEDRPSTSHLTEFYLMLSIGGVLGGLLNALAAPLLFTDVIEYGLVLGGACLLRPQLLEEWRARAPRARLIDAALSLLGAITVVWIVAFIEQLTGQDRLLQAGPGRWLVRELGMDTRQAVLVLTAGVPSLLCILVLPRAGSLRFAAAAIPLLLSTYFTGIAGSLLHEERTFFGVLRVSVDPKGLWYKLDHGTTLHGIQGRFEVMRRIPTTYYHPTGPIGDVIKARQAEGRMKRMGVVGLGVGSLAAYARPGDELDFFEIDEGVVRIADKPEYFLFVGDAIASGVKIRRYVGDGRLGISRPADDPAIPDGYYDLIVIDAFSSDVIPVHLVTREAIQAYRHKLAPGGVLAFHVSNRYFELRPVLWRIAQGLGMVCWFRDDSFLSDELKGQAKRDSVWVVLAATKEDLGRVGQFPTPWEAFSPKPGQRTPLWTDDYSNVLDAFIGWGMPD